jgi:hypothetical protein
VIDCGGGEARRVRKGGIAGGGGSQAGGGEPPAREVVGGGGGGGGRKKKVLKVDDDQLTLLGHAICWFPAFRKGDRTWILYVASTTKRLHVTKGRMIGVRGSFLFFFPVSFFFLSFFLSYSFSFSIFLFFVSYFCFYFLFLFYLGKIGIIASKDDHIRKIPLKFHYLVK